MAKGREAKRKRRAAVCSSKSFLNFKKKRIKTREEINHPRDFNQTPSIHLFLRNNHLFRFGLFKQQIFKITCTVRNKLFYRYCEAKVSFGPALVLAFKSWFLLAGSKPFFGLLENSDRYYTPHWQQKLLHTLGMETNFVKNNHGKMGGQPSHQFRALFRQRLALKLSQKASNCCQLCVPLFLVFIVGGVGLIIDALSSQFSGSNTPIYPPAITINPLYFGRLNGDAWLEHFFFVPPQPQTDIGVLNSSGYGRGYLGTLTSLQNKMRLDNGTGLFIPFFNQYVSAKGVDDALYDIQYQLREGNYAQNSSLDLELPDGAGITFTPLSIWTQIQYLKIVLFNSVALNSTLNETKTLQYTVQWPYTDYSNYYYLTAFIRSNLLYGQNLVSIINFIHSAQCKKKVQQWIQISFSCWWDWHKLCQITALYLLGPSLNLTIQQFPFYVSAGNSNLITSYMLIIALPFTVSLLIPNFVYLYENPLHFFAKKKKKTNKNWFKTLTELSTKRNSNKEN